MKVKKEVKGRAGRVLRIHISGYSPLAVASASDTDWLRLRRESTRSHSVFSPLPSARHR